MRRPEHPRRRAQRGKSLLVVLTDRDFDLLIFIGLCRYVSAAQVAREFFPSVDRGRRRLRDLFDAKYVSMHVVDSGRPNLVSLTKAGIAAVAEHNTEVAERLRLPGPLRLAGVSHHLLGVDARSYCARLSEAGGPSLLAYDSGVSARAAELGLPRLHLTPDGIATFAVTEGESTVAIECDCGQEGLRVIAAKFAKYAKAFDARLVDQVWLVVAAGVGRVSSLASAARDAGIASHTYLFHHTAILARPIVLPSRRATEERQAGGLNMPVSSMPEVPCFQSNPNNKVSDDRGADGRGTPDTEGDAP